MRWTTGAVLVYVAASMVWNLSAFELSQVEFVGALGAMAFSGFLVLGMAIIGAFVGRQTRDSYQAAQLTRALPSDTLADVVDLIRSELSSSEET